MNEKMRQTVMQSLMARIEQCRTQVEVLRKEPFTNELSEHVAYWHGEQGAAQSALVEIMRITATPCVWQGARG